MKKIAVVLFNLGGPNENTSVKNFLFNLFYDKAIISLPNPIRWFIAKFISTVRTPSAQKNYDMVGGFSPILANTQKQLESLEKELIKNKDYLFKNFICMRYSFPRAHDIQKEILDFAPDEIFLLPLYPQFSSTTTSSSVKEFSDKIKPFYKKPIKSLCCFFEDNKFIDSLASILMQDLEKIPPDSNFLVIFSAHGLPKKIIEKGDPYQWQVEQTVDKIVNKIGIKRDNYIISYQSRVGPVEWIKPYTDEVIIQAAKDKKTIILVPIAFVSEHLETLVELDIEYKELAHLNGAGSYIRINTPSCNEIFIESIADIIIRSLSFNMPIFSCHGKRVCADKFKLCINNNK